MQEIARFLGLYPAYTFEAVLAMPWHRYVTAYRLKEARFWPQVFDRMLHSGALDEAERIADAMFARIAAEAAQGGEDDG